MRSVRKNVHEWEPTDSAPCRPCGLTGVIGGDRPRSGFVDAMVEQIVEHLPEYEHRIEVSSVTRALGLMEQGE